MDLELGVGPWCRVSCGPVWSRVRLLRPARSRCGTRCHKVLGSPVCPGCYPDRHTRPVWFRLLLREVSGDRALLECALTVLECALRWNQPCSDEHINNTY